MIDTVHICTAADGNYKLPLMCLIKSVSENCHAHKYIIHVLSTGLDNKYKNKIQSKYKNTNISVDFIDMSKFDFDFHGIDMQHWTRAIFYRIMIPEIFKNLNRILYIDGDTLVLQDLYEFFNIQIPDDMAMAMVVDRFSYKSRIPVLNTKNYFNSGMILFDLDKCRNYDFSNRCVKWLYDNSKIAKFPDQDAINTIMDGKILRVNNLYNKQFATTDTVNIEKRPFVVHFLSAIKPWMKTAPIKYSSIYRRYMPNVFYRLYNLISQIVHASKDFCFHCRYGMKLENTKVIEYVKYYVFNICIWTKILDNKKPDLIDILKNNRDARKCQ